MQIWSQKNISYAVKMSLKKALLHLILIKQGRCLIFSKKSRKEITLRFLSLSQIAFQLSVSWCSFLIASHSHLENCLSINMPKGMPEIQLALAFKWDCSCKNALPSSWICDSSIDLWNAQKDFYSKHLNVSFLLWMKIENSLFQTWKRPQTMTTRFLGRKC